jgi:hypothetical protein
VYSFAIAAVVLAVYYISNYGSYIVSSQIAEQVTVHVKTTNELFSWLSVKENRCVHYIQSFF